MSVSEQKQADIWLNLTCSSCELIQISEARMLVAQSVMAADSYWTPYKDPSPITSGCVSSTGLFGSVGLVGVGAGGGAM